MVDRYLEFVAGRTRPNTLRAVAHDLKTFFSVIDKDPLAVVAADVSSSWPISAVTAESYGLLMASRGYRPAPLPGGCRRCRVSIRT